MDARRRISFNVNGGSINTSNYMTILALEDGLQAKLSGNTISYSLDEGNTWTSLASNTYTPTVNKGQTIMFKGNLTPSYNSGIGTFTINKKCNLEGNCMSLLFGDDAVNNNSLPSGKDYAFYNLFNGCTTIIEVSETFLPATTLSDLCYSRMFFGCSGLTSAPELPATTLDYACYQYMFYDCSSLTSAPVLPATTLTSGCYGYMFNGCSKLNYIKMLATSIVSGWLTAWVKGVSSTGTFVKNSAMTSLPTGISGIPSGWTVVNND